MDMEITDRVRADTLEVGDTFMDDEGNLVTIARVEEDGDLIMAYGEEDPDWPYTFAWDEVVDTYGYITQEV